MTANPIACSYCGGRHGHSMWCKRPSTDDKWRESIAIIDATVASFPNGKDRGRVRSTLMHFMCELVRANEDAEAKQRFADLMHEAGYHRPW